MLERTPRPKSVYAYLAAVVALLLAPPFARAADAPNPVTAAVAPVKSEPPPTPTAVAARQAAADALRQVYTPKPDLWLGLDLLRFPTAGYVGRLLRQRELTRSIPPFRELRTAPGNDTVVDGAPQPVVTVKEMELKTRRMQLEEARRLALRYQLDIQADLISPAIARAQVSEAWGKFDWILGGEASRTVAKPATKPPTKTDPQTIDDLASVSLTVPSPLGGGVQLTMPLTKHQVLPTPFGVPSPYYSVTPDISVTQPLFQGAGLRINMASINLARLSGEQSAAQAKLLITNLLANVDRSYWQLWSARQVLDVRYEQFELAQRQLAHAQSLAAAGMVPKMEILRSRVGIAQRVNDIIVAENQRRALERDFKRTLNVPGLSMDTPDVVVPSTEPDLRPVAVNSGELVQLALKNRMDLLVAQIQVAMSLVNRDVARNKLLPDVSLFFEGSRTTLGLTSRDTLNSYKDGPQENWTGGVRLTVPIGEVSNRARYRQAVLQHALSLNGLAQRKLAIEQDVYDAIDSVVQSWQQIQAASEEIDLTQRIYEGEQQLFERSIRTSTEVLDAAQFVANAKVRRISAIAGFEIAKVQLAYAIGAHLGYDRVDLVPYGAKRP